MADYWVQTNDDMKPVRVTNVSDSEMNGILKLLQVLASEGELVFLRDCKTEEDIFDNYAEWSAGQKAVTSSKKFTKYPGNYVKASSGIAYPWVTVEFHGEIKAYGSLKDDASLIKNIMEAMRRDDAFAKAMSDFYNPEYTTMEWDYSTYEEIAIGIVDFCKADYREWAALKSRGREDGDWVVISEDESIVIS